ncbi:hypothetical protein [Mesobacillus foraminis]|uniref:hypothetical protein n=1 Tax=Mesobacillus foraminis TaxID=279826 RepID=UPI000EF495D1|nr:hypothetical protein [Mesobacillus foraminis]
MNIGIGLLFLPLALIFIGLGGNLIKNNDKGFGKGLVLTGIIVLSGCMLLLTGLYDPYANHLE